VRSLTVPILTSGALIEVHLGLSDARRRVMQRQSRAVPPPTKATLLIDTGASMSLVDEALMRTLQITPTSVTSYHSSSTSGIAQQCSVYDVSLVLGGVATVNSLCIDPLPVMATAFINHPFEGLLGRDVLSRLQMAWSGRTQSLTLSYP
jgi:gag-polyprotein putative aspartyl protease